MTTISTPRAVTPSTILAKQLRELAAQIEDADQIDPTWQAGLRQACELAEGLDPYLDRWSSPESAELRLLAERTHREDWSKYGGNLEQEMLSGHVEGQLLKMLVHATRATRVLEIGMFTGYSALAMAEALPSDGRVIACEVDATVARFAQRCFDLTAGGRKIEVRVGAASRTLTDLAATGTAFDLIFIDADKAGYRSYLDTVLGSDLLSQHGLICVDNTLMQGQPWMSGESTANGEAIAAFNQAVAADPRVEQVIIPLRDGITLICLAGEDASCDRPS